MKKNTFLTVVVVLGLALFSGCASMHIWLVYENSAESKMVAIEERIGDGLKTGVLSPDQSQMFLTTLMGIKIDYADLKGENVYQEKWKCIHSRLDVLGEEINRALTPTTKIEEPIHWDKIATIQKSIDGGRVAESLPLTDEREFQAERLDSIRKDYLQMTEGGRLATFEEKGVLSQRLDSLAMDINRGR